MKTEIAGHADFSFIRYAQCWEDADVLNQALQVKEGDVCLSIASAGDNTLSLLAGNPARVIALDLNAAQLACLELRVAAYRELEHEELLALLGSRPHANRIALYRRCRPALSKEVRHFWDCNEASIERGIGSAGKFEHYFSLFRRRILPLVHNRKRVNKLLEAKSLQQREEFYAHEWNTLRWRLMFNLFFSRFMMGRMGRDPSFFNYVEGSVASRILERTRHALVELDPSQNPYLHWILTETHGQALPHALRKENFESIRENLDKLEWHKMTIEEFFGREKQISIDCFNLSDIFEYMSMESYTELLEVMLQHASVGARLAYWNMLAPRSRPASLADSLQAQESLAQQLHLEDKAFFYSRFVVEKVVERVIESTVEEAVC